MEAVEQLSGLGGGFHRVTALGTHLEADVLEIPLQK